jgi:hypothetical protein
MSYYIYGTSRLGMQISLEDSANPRELVMKTIVFGIENGFRDVNIDHLDACYEEIREAKSPENISEESENYVFEVAERVMNYLNENLCSEDVYFDFDDTDNPETTGLVLKLKEG